MDNKQGWTSGPQVRGTFDILWTCISTLALCVWTAVHPNISCVSSGRRAFMVRLGMMAVAVVLPEIIISAAWRQLKSAQWLRAEINALHMQTQKKRQNAEGGSLSNGVLSENELLRDPLLPPLDFGNGNTTTQRVPDSPQPNTNANNDALETASTNDRTDPIQLLEWTSEQAFFAVMGGFAIELDSTNPSSLQTNTPNPEKHLLSTEGILQLAKLGLLPNISTSEIEERSKADLIAKLLVLLQITWFALQVIGRLAGHLPLTLLETHTAVHVACTILIYLLWLKKPYDVQSSVVLSHPDVKDMAALFRFSRLLKENHARAVERFQTARVAYWRDRVVRASNNLLDYDPPPMPPVREPLTAAVARYCGLLPDQLPPSMVPSSSSSSKSKEQLLTSLAPQAQKAINMVRIKEGLSKRDVDSQNWDLLRENSENFAIREVWGSWSTDIGHDMSIEKSLHFLFNLLYGGGHLAAWASSSFPTPVEQWIWRVSAIVLTLMPLWGLMWVGWWKAVRTKWKIFYPVRNGDLDIVVAPFFFLLMLVYAVGRSFLLVESLISLRMLPKEAFKTVEWSEYLPHIS
ncbi:hypothetical protein ONS95_005916 [Cadophora gregata]|uniref:uncharacterized protein n=1 Tax=Cadophora gregata TaxID=51156 RepID=UPI0026DAEC8B|nr:uncharacterized protein ONS95_005916 [Cadophora gregata]KAK0102293.1 hypothetical protein ONS95_005916 [Cadophora gregata]